MQNIKYFQIDFNIKLSIVVLQFHTQRNIDSFQMKIKHSVYFYTVKYSHTGKTK